MLYSFLSESGVLDISLLALGTGIIVLSILGLLHLGKRRGHNKAGHFSEQPDDCAMPAVQTENSDEWASMEQPQTTEPVSGKKIVIPDFEQTYMTRHDIHVRSALYVSIDTKRKVLEVVKKIGSEYMTATSYVENIVRQHLELYKNDINRIYKQKGTKNLI